MNTLTFQSTLRRTERRCIFWVYTQHSLYFNPRSDERSDLSSSLVPTISTYFNPRSDERSDDNFAGGGGASTDFNPRSDERSDMGVKDRRCTYGYFNPRSDERSDFMWCETQKNGSVFQSTLRRTERHNYALNMAIEIVFQSTLRRTERRNCHVYLPLINNISIHAPTNGATFCFCICLCCVRYFNPRSDERSDGAIIKIRSILFDFNPRSDKRSDSSSILQSVTACISIHAPTNGATISMPYKFHQRRNFNPRSDERSDFHFSLPTSGSGDFNPRSDERSDEVFDNG